MVYYTRAIDELGRIVLPSDLRKRLGLSPRSSMILSEENGRIIIEESKPLCKICGDVIGKNQKFPLCDKCIKKIKNN